MHVRAEFWLDEKSIQLMLSVDDAGPPSRLSVTMRKCARSPVRTYDLMLDRWEETRGAYAYRVVGEREEQGR